MKIILPKNRLKGLLCILLWLFSLQAISQQWAYRAGYGTTAAGTDKGTSVAVDADGNVYLTGSYTGAINFGTGALPTATGADGFVAKFNAAGVCQWAMRFGGTPTAVDQGLAIATNGTSVYVAGTFTTNTTVGSSSTQYTAAGSIDGIIFKLNASTGATEWVTTCGGTSVDNVYALCIDGSGDVYISGNFFTAATFGSFSRTVNGGTGSDLFAAKLNGSTGSFLWVSTGGSLAANDNPGGSGICYVPDLNQVVVTGSYVSTTATYTTSSPVSTVILPISAGGGNDICVLSLNAANGSFVSGTGIGGSTAGNEEGLGICYDSFTKDVFLTGYFASSSLTFGTNPVISNPNGNDDIFIARFNPSTNAFVWSKSAGSSAGADRGQSIASNGSGGILVTGRFRGTMTMPGVSSTLSIVNSRANGDEVFLARLNAGSGVAQLLVQSVGNDLNAISNQGLGIIAGPNGNTWTTGSYGSNIVFPPLASLAPSGSATADIFLARFNDPLPLDATTSQTNVTCNIGCNGTATATPSGGVAPYTYSWSPSGGTSATATGLCPGTYTVTIGDAIGGSITRSVTITMPATQLATAPTSNTSFPVSSVNTMIHDASCNLIARIVPAGASPVSGNVSGRVWIESSVPVYPTGSGRPFVQRHYEITPATNAATATGRVTLYFTQAEFNNFNAHPGSDPKLPTGPADATGIANLRVAKYPGSTNDGTGLPGSYTGTATIIDPVDADIIWNAGSSRWEVTFDVAGFSGLIVQTSLILLPVDLLSFTAQIEGNDVLLKWTTQAELSHDYIEVERSTDGAAYTAIGRRSASATPGAVNHYDWTDINGAQRAGRIYYRLKIVSLTGQVQYSDAVIVSPGSRTSLVTGVLPNPFADKLQLSLNAPKSGRLDIIVTDMTGRVVLKQQATISKGFSTIPVRDVSRLSQGVYTLITELDGERNSIKIIK